MAAGGGGVLVDRGLFSSGVFQIIEEPILGDVVEQLTHFPFVVVYPVVTVVTVRRHFPFFTIVGFLIGYRYQFPY